MEAGNTAFYIADKFEEKLGVETGVGASGSEEVPKPFQAAYNLLRKDRTSAATAGDAEPGLPVH